jgi:hypothetical protein
LLIAVHVQPFSLDVTVNTPVVGPDANDALAGLTENEHTTLGSTMLKRMSDVRDAAAAVV